MTRRVHCQNKEIGRCRGQEIIGRSHVSFVAAAAAKFEFGLIIEIMIASKIKHLIWVLKQASIAGKVPDLSAAAANL